MQKALDIAKLFIYLLYNNKNLFPIRKSQLQELHEAIWLN